MGSELFYGLSPSLPPTASHRPTLWHERLSASVEYSVSKCHQAPLPRRFVGANAMPMRGVLYTQTDKTNWGRFASVATISSLQRHARQLGFSQARSLVCAQLCACHVLSGICCRVGTTTPHTANQHAAALVVRRCVWACSAALKLRAWACKREQMSWRYGGARLALQL